MFKFVTKKEYWNVVDSGILQDFQEADSCVQKTFALQVARVIRAITHIMGVHDFSYRVTWIYTRLPREKWHLKSIQDAIAFSYLSKTSNKQLAEIGGGNSRLLPVLAKNNTCFNIEEFEGLDGGPGKEIKFEGVTNIPTKVGIFSNLIENEKFDVIFSISVVEHIPTEEISAFFNDCHRILKPSGLMIHLVDVYLEDSLGDNKYASQRVCKYGSFLDGVLFEPLAPPAILSTDDVIFFTSFATNPDNMMERWNQLAPQLRDKRERAQSCTLLMVGYKIGPERESG